MRRPWIVLPLFLIGACSPSLSGTTTTTEAIVVSLGGWGSEEHVSPDQVFALPGELIQFRVADWRVYVVEFVADELSPPQVQFLEQQDRLRSPPLVERGQTFEVDLTGAPEGDYPFRIEGFGAGAEGVVIVRTTVTQ